MERNSGDRQSLRDDVYMNQARQISRLSKDENTHLGCVIIGADNTPVSNGYNGAISGYPDDTIPHSRENKALTYYEDGVKKVFLANKYPFMNHAEDNAMFFADQSKLRGATLYVTGFPCDECAKRIARNGIARVVVEEPAAADQSSMVVAGAEHHVAKMHFALKGVRLTVNGKEVRLSLEGPGTSST